MSLDAIRWAFRQREIRSSDKFVLVSMADRADERHQCWPSIQRLAADTNLDRKTVIAAICRLVEKGLLATSKREGVVTTYRLCGVDDRTPTGPENGTGIPRRSAPKSAPETGQTSTENGTGCDDMTSTENGTGQKTRTSTVFGTPPVPKTGHPPVPFLGHEPTIEPPKNLRTESATADLSGSAGNPTPACPHLEIIAAYNEILPQLPLVIPSRWGGTRERDLRTRWQESPKHQTLAFWRWFFAQVATSKYHLGENDRAWQADLGWLLQRRNFDRMLERFVSAKRRRAA